MRTPYLFAFILLGCIVACTPSKKKFNNTDSLPSEIVTIDPKKDTTLHTNRGAIIQIPKDALQAEGQSTVQLEIKEAYDISEMILAGLVTESNGKPLSSGGMIYIRAVGGKNVRLTKPISVAIPTPSIDDKMQLYKGEVKGDGTVNWKDPQPLAENPQLKALNLGKSLFINNCAACHSIDNKIVTGPSLAHMVKRSDWMIHYNDKSAFYHHDSIMVSTSPEHNLLYAYTRNNQKVLGMGLDYFTCLYNKYNKVQMPAYPNLTDEDLDNLYGYIENESMLRDLPIPDNGILKCSDSCRIYRETKTRLQEIKARLEKDSTDMRGIYFSAPNSPRTTIPPESGGLPIKVSPPQNRSLYYQFTIDVFGWYNVDMFLQQNTSTSESRLEVRVQGQYHERFNIYLVIPQVKLFGEGGQLEDKEDVYGFYTQDGKLPLPQNATAYILAMGEYEDQIIFAKKEFTTSKDQQLTIELQTISKETYRQEIGALSFSGLGISVADTKVAEELRKTIRNLKKAEELKPKTCDCNCFLRQEADSVLEEGPIITYPAK